MKRSLQSGGALLLSLGVVACAAGASPSATAAWQLTCPGGDCSGFPARTVDADSDKEELRVLCRVVELADKSLVIDELSVGSRKSGVDGFSLVVGKIGLPASGVLSAGGSCTVAVTEDDVYESTCAASTSTSGAPGCSVGGVRVEGKGGSRRVDLTVSCRDLRSVADTQRRRQLAAPDSGSALVPAQLHFENCQ